MIDLPGAFSKHVVQVWDFEDDVLPDIRDADHNIITNSAIMVFIFVTAINSRGSHLAEFSYNIFNANS